MSTLSRAPSGSKTIRSGCLPSRASRAWRSASSPSVSRVKRAAAKARAAAIAPAAGRPDEEVGVQRGGDRGPQVGLRPARWPTTSPQTSTSRRSREALLGTAADGPGPKTSSTVPVPSTTTHRSGRRRPGPGSRPPPGRGTRRPPPRGGRASVPHPGRGRLGRDVEQDDQVGPQAAGGPLVDRATHLDAEQAPAVALVGERRVDDSGRSRRPRRPSSAGRTTSGDVLGPVGGHEQRLGPGVQLAGGRVQHDAPAGARRPACRPARG